VFRAVRSRPTTSAGCTLGPGFVLCRVASLLRENMASLHVMTKRTERTLKSGSVHVRSHFVDSLAFSLHIYKYIAEAKCFLKGYTILYSPNICVDKGKVPSAVPLGYASKVCPEISPRVNSKSQSGQNESFISVCLSSLFLIYVQRPRIYTLFT